jgi:hypothetical protein
VPSSRTATKKTAAAKRFFKEQCCIGIPPVVTAYNAIKWTNKHRYQADSKKKLSGQSKNGIFVLV